MNRSRHNGWAADSHKKQAISALEAMKKSLSVSLDEKVMERLKARCGEDEKAMQSFATQAIEKALSQASAEDEKDKNAKPPHQEKQDLRDYLKKGAPGSRSYGIKGQGW